MRVRRSYLFWGTFLVLVGGIPLFVRWSGVDVSGWDRSWSWWPLILIVLGLAIVFARTRLNVAAVALAGVLLGGLVGTALAASAGDLFGGIGFRERARTLCHVREGFPRLAAQPVGECVRREVALLHEQRRTVVLAAPTRVYSNG